MATVYISSTGSDAYTYAQAQSSATPWLTIGKANTSATTGDTIVIMAGTITLTSVTFTKSFTIQGATSISSLYILSGGGLPATLTIGANTITLKDLRITNVINITGSFYYMENSSNLTLTNVITDNITLKSASPNSGLFTSINTNPTALTLTNSTFYKIKYATTGDIYGGFFMFFNWTGSRTVTVTNCTFHIDSNNGYLSVFLNHSGGIYTFILKNCIISNGSGATYTYLRNFGGGSRTENFSYNDFYLVTTAPTSTFSITSDPLFVDPANGNFNLRPTSPCIDTGTLV